MRVVRYALILLNCLLCAGCFSHTVGGKQHHDHNVQGTQQHEHNVHHSDQRIDVHIWKHKRREKAPQKR